MATRIWRRPSAEEDLLEIWTFIAADNIAAADSLIQAIADKCELLLDYPELGRRRPDIGENVRMLLVEKYLVLYAIAADRIEIVRVVHGARDLSDLV